VTRSWIVALLAFAATVAVAAAVVVWMQTRDDSPTASSPSSSTSVSSTTEASTPPPSTSTTASATSAGTGLLTEPPPVGDSALDLVHFRSPSGNIGCYLTTEQAHCEIAEYNFALPPEPPSCDLDWVAALKVGTGAEAAPTIGGCQSDTVLGAEDVLPYDTFTVLGDFACLSQETGMSCWNLTTRRGFTLSRAAYVLF
jgi:hypothetical protein